MEVPADNGYRIDIDGLRAIAVLAVVLFHVDERWVPAGFIGVDIFFVISGFLITGIVDRGIRQRSFSLATFYRNRIRRIAPVLGVVVVLTLLAGQFILLPGDLERLARSAVASEFFVANIYFYSFLDTGYFASNSRLEPLLHLWSLGAEEQFYLIWPLLFLLASRVMSHVQLGIAAVVLVLASFLFGQYYYATDPMFVYYMLPARAGQLLSGALCYFALSWGRPASTKPATLLVAMGLALIAWTLWSLKPDDPFPGFNAIPVTLAAALVLYGGATDNPLSRLLGTTALAKIGLLSYSLYLWHWPVLAYVRYVYPEPELSLQLIALVIIFALSWFSLRLVETPCRRDRAPLRQVFLRYLLFPALLVLSSSLLLVATNGYGVHALGDDYKEELQRLTQAGRMAPSARYVCQKPIITQQLLLAPECVIGDAPTPRVAVWGDSNASHYVGALKVLARHYGFSFRNFASGACPPVLEDPGRYTNSTARPRCAQFVDLIRDHLQQYEVIIMSGNWEWYLGRHKDEFETALSATLATMLESGQRVLVLGHVPHIPGFDRSCEAKAVKLGFMDCASLAIVSDGRVNSLNAEIRRISLAAGAEYLDFNNFLCKKGRCRGIIRGISLYFDDIHLSASGSEQLGRWVRKDGYGGELFRGLAD